MNQSLLNGLTEPSDARLMRLEIALVGMPGNITEMRTEQHHLLGHRNSHGAGPVQIFSDEDDKAIRKMLMLPQECDGTFVEQIREFFKLRNRYVYSVPGFGAFIKKEDVAGFVEKTNDFNARLRELRASVRKLLEARYANKDVSYHNFILRFNPRIRYGIFLLSRQFVSDKYFIRACADSAYKGLSRYNKENLLPWIVETSTEV